MPTNDRTTAELLAALCDETISHDEMRRLDRLIVSDAEVRRQYLEYLDIHARLSCQFHQPVDALPVMPSVEAAASISPLPSSLSPDFVGGPVFSYLVATVLMCAMLLSAWAYKVSRVQENIGALAGNTTKAEAVGRITGAVGCRWRDPGQAPVGINVVRLGSEYALSAGLLEITYNAGAKVILQGPCVYRVDSAAGGYLSRGKLVARVEKNDELGLMNDESNGRGSGIQHSSFINHHLFVVRTPAAVVTDLGTEFGVNVGENGDTTSYVFQGTVRVEAMRGTGSASVAPTTLIAGESVMVSRVRETHQESALTEKVRFTHPTVPPTFVRTLVQPPKQLDLLDMIAGGNGLTRLRERGIDPTTGMEDPMFSLGERTADKKYQPVAWHKLIDGVFIPNGGEGPVEVNSAGGTFDGFPKTAGSTWGSIWPRAAVVDQVIERRGWIYEITLAEKFMPERLGLIGVCPNVGVTFDLAAIREMYKEIRPDRLRTVAGLGDRKDFESPFDGKIDLWVIVDGQSRLKRRGLKRCDGTVEIDVELAATDRFLTLAVTDGGDGQAADWVIFGDPVLQMKPIEEKPLIELRKNGK